MSADKQTDGKRKVGDGTPGPGRPKGSTNKATKALKEMILAALDQAGGETYLVTQAKANPTAFLTLIGKVLPSEVNMKAEVETRVISDQPLTPEQWAHEHAPPSLQ